jgi:putative transcriptional regulator
MAVKTNYTALIKQSVLEAAEIRQSMTKNARVTVLEVVDVIKVRQSMNLTRAKFASLIGVSERTLESWEQGRSKPTGAARSLLRVASRQPKIVFESLR